MMVAATGVGHDLLRMMTADEIWNRACAEAGGPKKLTAPGDRALADMLLAHGLAMNGGVLHAIACLTEIERDSAVRGYRYFGLQVAANVIEDSSVRWSDGLDLDEEEQLEADTDNAYALAVRDDGILVAAFKAKIETEPDEFDVIG